jgi:integrase
MLASKSKIYRTLRKFLKWKYGENKYYPTSCDDWVTTEDKVTKEHITRSEVEKMVTQATTTKIKCFIMMLFDGGFRIEEIANLRWADVKKEEGKDYYRAEVRGETSKTKKPRVVSLWLSTDLIETYKNSIESKKKRIDPNEYLFDTKYNTLYTEVVRLGKRALNKDIAPHTLRHSSATYYANIIKTYQQFCRDMVGL